MHEDWTEEQQQQQQQQQPASEEQVWAQLICPVPVKALAALAEMAPEGAVIRPGGQTFHEGSFHNVVEVVVQ
jgi:hypothetical protein